MVAPKKIPIEDIICRIEECIKHLPKRDVEEICQECAITLRRERPPNRNIKGTNITKDERRVVRYLINKDTIVILKYDKCGATIIMDKPDYVEKMKYHLN